MLIKWYGHSCFLLTNSAGNSVLMDPCDKETGYILHDIHADVVTSSHSHHDHNYFGAAPTASKRISEPGVYDEFGIHIEGYPSFHDKEQGKLRGPNVIFVVTMDGMRVAHMGDLGDMPSADVLEKLHGIDILLMPVGGTFTLDANEALELSNSIDPKVMIPMHYMTPDLTFEIATLQSLLDCADSWSKHRLNDCEAVLTPDSLGKHRLLMLNYKK